MLTVYSVVAHLLRIGLVACAGGCGARVKRPQRWGVQLGASGDHNPQHRVPTKLLVKLQVRLW